MRNVGIKERERERTRISVYKYQQGFQSAGNALMASKIPICNVCVLLFLFFTSQERNRCNYRELNVIFNQNAIKFFDILKHRLDENLRKET